MTHISDYVDEYINVLNSAASLAGLDYLFDKEVGRRYVKVVQNSAHGGRSVHAFIERSSGDLLKPASWAAPQRNSDGSLAVRYRLSDEIERKALFEKLMAEPANLYGGYLYK